MMRHRPQLSPSGPVYVIGGGASLSALDPDMLRDQQVVVVNEQYRLFPWAVAHFAGDAKWWAENGAELRSAYGGYAATSEPRRKPERQWGDFGEERWIHTSVAGPLPGSGIDVNADCLRGSCSGHQAINLAYQLGARTVILLGFDAAPVNGQWHWYQDSNVPGATQADYSFRYNPEMEALAAEAPHVGLTIFNATPASALRCFTAVGIRDVLQ